MSTEEELVSSDDDVSLDVGFVVELALPASLTVHPATNATAASTESRIDALRTLGPKRRGDFILGVAVGLGRITQLNS